MNPRHSVLFEPIAIGPKVLPNRFYQVPHASGFGVAMPRSQAAFRGIKAEGGWGGVCVEYAPVSRDSDETPAVAADFFDEDDAAALRLTVEAIHAHGALAGIELFHGGVEDLNGSSRLPSIAPSQLAHVEMPGAVPKEMTLDDIARVQSDWAEAARRARDCGFDIVYVYGAHGYLLTQFFSSFFNHRRDRYGGSLENRARFWLETLAAVRDAVGQDCAVATRIGVDFRGEPGITIDEALELVALADPLVDLFDVNTGTWPQDSGTSRYFPEGHGRPWTSQVRSATRKPIVTVGRFNNPDLMADLVRSGELDIIGAARPAIADPFMPTKIAEGRIEDIRECTGSNVCILKEEVNRHVGCVQNPTAGEEFRRGWHPEVVPPSSAADRSVLVVGGGPAGMECALTLGRRGHAVHLVEAAQELGGHLRWVRRLPTLGELGRVVDWRATQLGKLANVTVVRGSRLGAADVLDYGAAIVIVATGSSWSAVGLQPRTHEPIPGADAALPFVLTPEQVMLEDKKPAGQDVVVYDCEGYLVGAGIAERLRLDGYAVTIVTPFDVVSPVSDQTLEGPFLRAHLHELGIGMRRNVVVRSVSPAGITGVDELGDPVEIRAGSVVVATQRVSDSRLWEELSADPAALFDAGIAGLYRIGDAVAPRMTPEAVFDGHRLAMEIDSANPAAALPVDRREQLQDAVALRTCAGSPRARRAGSGP